MKVLVIEDQSDVRELVRSWLIAEGIEVSVADETNYRDYLDPAPDVIVTDLIMPTSDGLEITQHIHEQRLNVRIIFMSQAHRKVLESAERFAEALGLNVGGTLSKPLMAEELLALVRGSGAAAKVRLHASPPEEHLVELIREGAIVTAFQEQLNISSGEVVAAEALARLHDKSSGTLIYPDDFIELAMRRQLMPLITRAVWQQTLELAKRCARAGRRIGFSLNLTLTDAADAELPARLLASVLEAQLTPGLFTIEITETVVYQNDPAMLAALTRMRMYGFKLAIDDFGTGYSSMKQLMDLPFSELKIDKSFIMNSHKPEGRAVVETSIGLGQKIGMVTVAEGVETGDFLTYLGSLGCDLAQGYHIGRPLVRDAFELKLGL